MFEACRETTRFSFESKGEEIMSLSSLSACGSRICIHGVASFSTLNNGTKCGSDWHATSPLISARAFCETTTDNRCGQTSFWTGTRSPSIANCSLDFFTCRYQNFQRERDEIIEHDRWFEKRRSWLLGVEDWSSVRFIGRVKGSSNINRRVIKRSLNDVYYSIRGFVYDLRSADLWDCVTVHRRVCPSLVLSILSSFPNETPNPLVQVVS